MSTETRTKKAYSFRLPPEKGQRITDWARENRRSFTAEVDLLIDQGIAWRKEHGNKIPSQE